MAQPEHRTCRSLKRMLVRPSSVRFKSARGAWRRSSLQLLGCGQGLTVWLILVACAQTLISAERLWYFDASGETLRSRTGRVESYEDGEWQFEVDGGGTLKIPSTRVTAIEFEGSTSWARGLTAFEKGEWQAAYPDLIQAFRDEKRPWAQFEIQAIIIQCALATGRDEIACRAFQELLDADPKTRHRHLAPLAWNRGVATPAWQPTATQWLRSDNEWDRLMGASWLLQTTGKDQARGVLIDLGNSRDKAIRYLSVMQLRRDDAPLATQAQWQQWRVDIEQGPIEFRAGPRSMLAQVSSRLAPGNTAALDHLHAAFEAAPHPLWIAEGLLGAARELAQTQPREARTLLDELQQRFPDSDAAKLGRNLKLESE